MILIAVLVTVLLIVLWAVGRPRSHLASDHYGLPTLGPELAAGLSMFVATAGTSGLLFVPADIAMGRTQFLLAQVGVVLGLVVRGIVADRIVAGEHPTRMAAVMSTIVDAGWVAVAMLVALNILQVSVPQIASPWLIPVVVLGSVMLSGPRGRLYSSAATSVFLVGAISLVILNVYLHPQRIGLGPVPRPNMTVGTGFALLFLFLFRELSSSVNRWQLHGLGTLNSRRRALAIAAGLHCGLTVATAALGEIILQSGRMAVGLPVASLMTFLATVGPIAVNVAFAAILCLAVASAALWTTAIFRNLDLVVIPWGTNGVVTIQRRIGLGMVVIALAVAAWMVLSRDYARWATVTEIYYGACAAYSLALTDRNRIAPAISGLVAYVATSSVLLAFNMTLVTWPLSVAAALGASGVAVAFTCRKRGES